jgi:hypothetical protein
MIDVRISETASPAEGDTIDVDGTVCVTKVKAARSSLQQ